MWQKKIINFRSLIGFILVGLAFSLLAFSSISHSFEWTLTSHGLSYQGKHFDIQDSAQTSCGECSINKHSRFYPEGPELLWELAQNGKLRALQGQSSNLGVAIPNREGRTFFNIEMDFQTQQWLLVLTDEKVILEPEKIATFTLYGEHYQLLILSLTKGNVEYVWLKLDE